MRFQDWWSICYRHVLSKKIFNLISAFLFPQKKKKKFVGKLQCGCDDIKIFLNDIIFGDQFSFFETWAKILSRESLGRKVGGKQSGGDDESSSKKGRGGKSAEGKGDGYVPMFFRICPKDAQVGVYDVFWLIGKYMIWLNVQ